MLPRAMRFGIAMIMGFALGLSPENPSNTTVLTNKETGEPQKQSTGSKQERQPMALHVLEEPTRIVLANNAIQPHVSVSAQGAIHVAFISKGNIVVSTSTDRGKTFSEPILAIDVKGHARGGRQRGPRIGVDADNNIIVTAPVSFDRFEWKKKYPRAELYLVSSHDGGKTWSEPIRVNEQPKKAPEALHWLSVAPNGTAHIAWLDLRDRNQRGQDIYYAKYANGKLTKNIPVARTVCECCAPGLSVDGSNNPFLAFREGGDKDSREIFARRSQDQGASFAKQFQINQKASQEFG